MLKSAEKNVPRQPLEREIVLRNFADKLSADGGMLTLQQAYDIFKEIEAEMRAAEDDQELYDALSGVRKELKIAMEVRAQELGKSDDWAQAMQGHDAMLMLRPLFRAQDDAQEYVKAYRALTSEQRAALDYWEKKTGVRLSRPETIEAELRWNNLRRGTLLRMIPDPGLTHTWPERIKATLFGLALTAGFAFAAAKRFWAAALVLLAVLLVVGATWTRDLVSYMRSQKSKNAS